MPSDMKSAWEKAGYKGAKPPAAPAQQPAAGKFVLRTDYADQADEVIKALRSSLGRNYQYFTTSKIRNILALVSAIYNDALIQQGDTLDADLQNRIEYLKVRLVYESGREPRIIKPFVEKAGLLKLLNAIGDSKKNFIDFARYMEALVAYHRFHGGKD